MGIVTCCSTCGGRDSGSFLFISAVESCAHKHAGPHKARIPHFDADLRGANVRVQHGPDITDRAGESLIGVRIQPNIGLFAEAHVDQIVFVDIAQHPDVAQVRDGEGIRRTKPRHTSCVGDLLVRDDPGNRRVDLYQTAGTIKRGTAQNAKFLGSIRDVYLGFVFSILCDLKIVLGDRTFVVKQFGALQLSLDQLFICNSFLVIGESAGDVRALHLQQQLPFLNGVTQTRVYLDNSPHGQ